MAVSTIMYHYIREKYNGAGIFGLTPQQFRQMLNVAASKYRIIRPDELRIHLELGDPLPENAVLLTFDDGLKDHCRFVLPILAELDLAGLFFILTRPLQEKRLCNTQRVHLLRQHLGEEAFVHEMVSCLPAEWARQFETGDGLDRPGRYRWDGDHLARVKSLVSYELPGDLAETVLSALFAKHLGAEEAACAMMHLDWDDAAEMQRKGMTLGAHGHTHQIYARLSPIEQEADISRCLDILHDKTTGEVWSFCYPFGKMGTFDDHTRAILQDHGIACAFTSMPGMSDLTGDRLAISRFDPHDLEEEAS